MIPYPYTHRVDTGAVMAKLNRLLAQPGAKRILITPDGKVRRLDPLPRRA